jgi:hypothetical protein
MLVEMYPELEEYFDDQGKLTAECLKALYGLIESGKLWYDTIKEKLIKNGYVQNPYEPCIFNKWHEDKQVQSTIGVYVDDLITTCKNEHRNSRVNYYLAPVRIRRAKDNSRRDP